MYKNNNRLTMASARDYGNVSFCHEMLYTYLRVDDTRGQRGFSLRANSHLEVNVAPIDPPASSVCTRTMTAVRISSALINIEREEYVDAVRK